MSAYDPKRTRDRPYRTSFKPLRCLVLSLGPGNVPRSQLFIGVSKGVMLFTHPFTHLFYDVCRDRQDAGVAGHGEARDGVELSCKAVDRLRCLRIEFEILAA